MFCPKVSAYCISAYNVIQIPHKKHILCHVIGATPSCSFTSKVPGVKHPSDADRAVEMEESDRKAVGCIDYRVFLKTNLIPKCGSRSLYSVRKHHRYLKPVDAVNKFPDSSGLTDSKITNNINANSSCEEIEEFAERIVEACRQDEPSENANVNQSVEEKSNGMNQKVDECKNHHVNRFRKIIYSEGELDHSDLSLPPSRSNPHPFDPSLNSDLLPPTHSRSLAQYVNHLPVLQNLIELGVSLFTIERTSAIGKELVKLNWEADVLPKLAWLINLDVPVTKLGDYLTRNPFFLLQNFEDMKARVNYLRSKRFMKSEIAKIIITFRYWLNFDVRIIDSRLGWMQKSFKLSGNEVRKLVVLEPRILAFGVAPIKRMSILLSEEFAFSEIEIKNMLMKEPRLFIQNASQVAASYIYAHFVMGLSNAQIAEYPLVIRCPITYLERRHQFLVRMKRNKYVPGTDDYVSLDAFLHPSDKYFATNVARSFLISYNSFIKRV